MSFVHNLVNVLKLRFLASVGLEGRDGLSLVFLGGMTVQDTRCTTLLRWLGQRKRVTQCCTKPLGLASNKNLTILWLLVFCHDEEPSVVVVHLAADETLPDRTEVCDDFLRLLLECGFAGAPTGQADTYSDTCRNLVVWTRQFHRLKSRPISKAIEKSVKDCSVISAVHD